jgi:HlyD family secretion protein
LVVLVLVFAILGGSMIYVQAGKITTTYRTAAVTYGTITQTIGMAGNLVPVSEADLNFAASGTVQSVDVAVGQSVPAGATLAALDPTVLSAQLLQSQATLSSAQSKLSQDQAGPTSSSLSSVQNAVAAALVSFNNAQTSLGDTQTINAQSVTAAQDALTSAQVSVNNAQTSLADTQAINAQAVATAQAPVTPAQNTVTVDQGLVAQDQGTLTTDETTMTTDCAASSSSSACIQDTAVVATDKTKLAADEATLAHDQATLAGASASLAAAIAKAQQSNDQAAASVASAQQQLASAKTSLATTVAKAQQSNDQAAASVASATQQLAAARSSLAGAQTSSTSSQTIQIDEAQIQIDQVNVNTLQHQLDGATLTAPIAGIVSQVNVKAGQAVTGGGSGSSASYAIVIFTPGSYAITGSVSDSQVNLVAVGQTTQVTPAGSTQAVLGKVSAIAPAATVVSGVATFGVTAQLTDTSNSIKPGISATATIVVNQVVHVLTVPTSAVHTNPAGSTVQILVNGAPQSIAVQVGASDPTRTEIVSGLNLNQVVVIAVVTSSVPSSNGGAGTVLGGGGGGRVRAGGGG